MTFEHLVVIGGSAGGIEALRAIVAGLPPGFGAPICVVVHMSPEAPGLVHHILAKSGPLGAVVATSGQRLEPATIHVAPVDRHLLIEPGTLQVSHGPKENRFRPAIDPLFRSAAQVYGPRVIGVLLSGNLDDGTAGLSAIKRLGGQAIVQDPGDAMCPSMPLSALRYTKVDYTARAPAIGPLLGRLIESSVHERLPSRSDVLEAEVQIAKGADPMATGIQGLGRPSQFACPECHGVLRELNDEGRLRYRCHTGHAYSPDSLLAANDEALEGALLNAARASEEAGRLMRALADQLTGFDPAQGEQLRARAKRALEDAQVIRRVDERRSRHPSATTGVSKE